MGAKNLTCGLCGATRSEKHMDTMPPPAVADDFPYACKDDFACLDRQEKYGTVGVLEFGPS